MDARILFFFVIQSHVENTFTNTLSWKPSLDMWCLQTKLFSWLCHLACIKVVLYIYLPRLVQLIKHQGRLSKFMWVFQSLLFQNISCLLHQEVRPSSFPQLLDLTSSSCPWQFSLLHSTQAIYFVVSQQPAAFTFLPCHAV